MVPAPEAAPSAAQKEKGQRQLQRPRPVTLTLDLRPSRRKSGLTDWLTRKVKFTPRKRLPVLPSNNYAIPAQNHRLPAGANFQDAPGRPQSATPPPFLPPLPPPPSPSLRISAWRRPNSARKQRESKREREKQVLQLMNPLATAGTHVSARERHAGSAAAARSRQRWRLCTRAPFY